MKTLVPKYFDKEKYVLHYENFQLFLKLELKLKNIHHVLEFNQSQWLNYMPTTTHKKIDAKENGGKDEKTLYKLIKNAAYGKTMENLRNIIDVRIVSNEKNYLKWKTKPSYMSQKIFYNDLITIRKSKVTLTLNKPVYVRMCILDLSKVLIYEFHYDQIKNKNGNNSRLLFIGTDSLMYEIKTEDIYKEFKYKNKEMLDFINYFDESNYYDDSNKLMVG